ncbi:MAG: alanine racemase [Candidatus Absconditicoccaceae bacterium]
MISFLRKIFLPNPDPMNVIYINKKNIINNMEVLQSLQPKAEIFPVLKSNAYGHGLKQITKIIRKLDVPYIVVDSFPEYMIVKKYAKQEILLLGETLPENYYNFNFKRTTFCISNIQTLEVIGKMNKEVRIHIFLNTGMNREGIDEENLIKFIDVLKQYPKIAVTGVMSHFHSADKIYGNNIDDQIEKFKKMYYEIVNAGYSPMRRHIGNSAGMMKMKDDFFNAFRPGLAMYGYNPLEQSDEKFVQGKKLKPAMTIMSRIVSLHNLSYGQGVSYGQEYKSYENEKVATIPFGYAEGLPRSISGKLMFGNGGRKYFKQVGTICMNMCSILVDGSANLYDEIEIISENISSKNTLKSLVEQSGMITYEFLVKLDKGIRREII